MTLAARRAVQGAAKGAHLELAHVRAFAKESHQYQTLGFSPRIFTGLDENLVNLAPSTVSRIQLPPETWNKEGGGNS